MKPKAFVRLDPGSATVLSRKYELVQIRHPGIPTGRARWFYLADSGNLVWRDKYEIYYFDRRDDGFSRLVG